jgi:hypothetical protein
MTFDFIFRKYLPWYLLYFVLFYIVHIGIDLLILDEIEWFDAIKDSQWISIMIPLVHLYRTREKNIEKYYKGRRISRRQLTANGFVFVALLLVLLLIEILVVSRIIPYHPKAYDFRLLLPYGIMILVLGGAGILVFNQMVWDYIKNNRLAGNAPK